MTPALGTGLCFPTQRDAEPNRVGQGHLLHLNRHHNTDEGPAPHSGQATAELGEKERAERGATAPHVHHSSQPGNHCTWFRATKPHSHALPQPGEKPGGDPPNPGGTTQGNQPQKATESAGLLGPGKFRLLAIV